MKHQEADLTRFFARLTRRPIAVLMLVVALLGMGGIAGSMIPIELQPKGFAGNTIVVSAPWPGANPQEIERRILRPIEREMRTIQGLDEIMARAGQGVGSVMVSFPGTADMDQAYAEVADRVERVRPNLPRDADRISLRRWTTADMPILWVGILYPPDDSERVQDIMSDVFQPRMEAIDGVANVNTFGIEPRSVRIWLDEARSTAAGVDIGALVGRLQQDNLSAPIGDLDDAGSRFIVRVDGRFKNLEEIENYPIRDGLKLKDVGRVALVRSAPDDLFRVNGAYGLGVAISKESSANTFEVCRKVERFIEDEIPNDPTLGQFQYKIFWNAGDSIYESLRSLVTDALIGGGIACLVLMLFLRRVRYTLLIAASIPFSVLLTLAWLYFTGDSFNLFSMMGITISIGMLVDNSVVIVESIFKQRESGKSLEEASTKGPAEVTLAVVTATLTSVVVFLPLIFMSSDRNAKVFTRSIGVPLCIALMSALMLAIVIVPVACRYMASRPRKRAAEKIARVSSRHPIFRPSTWMPGLAAWSLRNRLTAVCLAAMFLFSGQYAMTGKETQMDLAGFGGQLNVDFEFSANTTLWDAEEEVIRMEEALATIRPEIGNPDIGIEFNRRGGEINFWSDVQLKEDEEEEVLRLVKDTLPKRAAVEYHFGKGFDVQDTNDEKWLRIAIEGPDSTVVASITEEVRRIARESGEFKEIADDNDPAREVLLTLDRERMQRMAVNSQTLLATVEWTLRGFMVSRFETERSDLPIIIEYEEETNPTKERLSEMAVAGFGTGAALPLSTFASFEHARGPRYIFRENGKTLQVVGLRPKDDDVRKNAALLGRVMNGIEMPDGYGWRQAGGWDDFQNDLSEIKGALNLAILLVFFLMGLLFESVILPFSVLFTIPFAIVGAFWSFKLFDAEIEIIAWIGMIVLAGVVVNNGIVLVDRIIRLRRSGVDRTQAIVEGVRDRMRPVLMTAMTTICGLAPIALSEPTGNGFSFKGLAIGVAGGLACTTFFTLWVVPLAYSLLDDLSVVLRRIALLPSSLRAKRIPGS